MENSAHSSRKRQAKADCFYHHDHAKKSIVTKETSKDNQKPCTCLLYSALAVALSLLLALEYWW